MERLTDKLRESKNEMNGITVGSSIPVSTFVLLELQLLQEQMTATSTEKRKKNTNNRKEVKE